MVRRAILATCAALLVGLVFANHARIQAAASSGNYSALLRISTRWFDSNPMLRSRTGIRDTLVLDHEDGYDAQFTYFAVFDPLVTRYAHAPDNYGHMMDAAPYRFGRIGHVWLTRLIAREHWPRYPETMVWTVVAGCAVTALAVALVAWHWGRSPAWGLMVAAVPGFWQSVQVGLSEPLAAAAMVAGYWVWLRQRWGLATVLFAVSLLTRETGIILVLCLAIATWQSHRRPALLLFVGSLLPLVLWRWHVADVLYSTWGRAAFFYNPDNLGLPFAGMLAMWSGVAEGTYFGDAPEVARAGVVFSVLAIWTSGLAFAVAWRRRTAVSVAAACYALVVLSMNYPAIWAHVANAQRGSYELFLCLALASLGHLDRNTRAAAVITIGGCALYLLGFASDASAVRNAFGL